MDCRVILLCPFLLAGVRALSQADAHDARLPDANRTAPVLLPQNISISAPKHCDALDGMVKFSGIVDATGSPQGLKTLETSDRRLAGFAAELIEGQRFKPATLNGSPTAAAVEFTVGLHTCAQHESHPTDDHFYRFALRAHPMIAMVVVPAQAAGQIVAAATSAAPTAEAVGEKISSPIPTTVDDPQIPISRKLHKHGLCLLSVTIDADGIPSGIRVVRSLDPELDNYAAEAVRNWRFRPALREGRIPVAIDATIAATFEYYDKEPVAFAFFIPEPSEKVEAAIERRTSMRWKLDPPVNANEVIARYMPQSRVSGRCLISLVVDTEGVPQNVHIVRGLDAGVDEDTVAMVEHLRFTPVKDGTTPVPVGVLMPVRYRAMLRPTWAGIVRDIVTLVIIL